MEVKIDVEWVGHITSLSINKKYSEIADNTSIVLLFLIKKMHSKGWFWLHGSTHNHAGFFSISSMDGRPIFKMKAHYALYVVIRKNMLRLHSLYAGRRGTSTSGWNTRAIWWYPSTGDNHLSSFSTPDYASVNMSMPDLTCRNKVLLASQVAITWRKLETDEYLRRSLFTMKNDAT